MKKLILIRHGETNYTREKRYCGIQDIPLNKEGRTQALCLNPVLRKVRPDKIYSSDLLRAMETAEIVFKDKKIYQRKELREIDFGLFSGRNYDEVMIEHSDLYKKWVDHPEGVKIPGGESLLGFSKRVEKCFREIAGQNKDKVVALVTHGGPIRIICLKLMKKGLDKFWEIEQDTASLNIIEFRNRIPRFIKLNDTSHLRQEKAA